MNPVGLTVRILQLLFAAIVVCAAPVRAQEIRKVDSEKFLLTLSDEIHRRETIVGFAHLPEKEQTFLLIWALEAEVNNGGFHQFFFNSPGDHAAATVEALRTIGAAKTARLVGQAMSVFGSQGPSKNRFRRQEQLLSLPEKQEEKLSDLDTAFYAYPDNLSELLASYMRTAK